MKVDPALPPLLVVDDDDDDALLFARRLKEAGIKHPVLHFRDGTNVFLFLRQFCTGEKLAEQRPCVMFLDVNMPDLSGFDVLVWARQQPVLQGMKIIMVSGATEPWDAKIAAKLGADSYLPKFPEPAQLSRMLGPHLTGATVSSQRADGERPAPEKAPA
jgi:CheY-like chemotaxis protein